MFDIATQLFEGPDIRFAPIDYDTDPEVESKWMHDAEFARLYEVGPARPLSPATVKKQYEKMEKRMEEEKNFYHFMIRAKSDDRLIGKAMVARVEWTNGNGQLRIGIGAAEDRCKGYGSQALRMLLRFAFAELNLFRASADVRMGIDDPGHDELAASVDSTSVRWYVDPAVRAQGHDAISLYQDRGVLDYLVAVHGDHGAAGDRELPRWLGERPLHADRRPTSLRLAPDGCRIRGLERERRRQVTLIEVGT